MNESFIENSYSIGYKIEDAFSGKSGSMFKNLIIPLLRRLNWKGDIRYIVESLPFSTDWFGLVDFRNVFANLGFKSEKVNIDLNKINSEIFPCIFINKAKKLYLLLNKEDNYIEALNPENSEEIYFDINQLSKKECCGEAYYFHRLKDRRDAIELNKNWFYDYLAKFKKHIFSIISLTFICNIFLVFTPVFIMSIYDRVIPLKSTYMLNSFTLGVSLTIIGSYFMIQARSKILSYVGARLERVVSLIIMKRILYLPAMYTTNSSVSNQVAKIKSFECIYEFITGPLLIVLCELPFTMLFLAVIFFLGGWLGIIPIVLAVLFLTLYFLTNPIVDKISMERVRATSIKQNFLLESLTNIKDIKELGLYDSWEDRYKDILLDSEKYRMKVLFITSTLNSISEWLMLLSAAGILYFGSLLALESSITVGALIAIMMLVWKVLGPIHAFFASLSKFSQVKNSIRELNMLVSMTDERQENTFVSPLRNFAPRIEFSKVSLRHRPNSPPALLGVSFKVLPTEIVCLTGKDASGRSSILNLMIGMNFPQAGSIRINGLNVQQYDSVELRHFSSFLSEKAKIFRGTLEYNLRLSHPTASNYEMEVACRMADIHDEIMKLPEKYNTEVSGGDDRKFSRVFKNKFLLAKVYINKADLLLLDEPERYIQNKDLPRFIQILNWMRRDKTIVMITNSPAFLKIATKIIHMSEGEILLQGPPAKVFDKVMSLLEE